MQTNAPCHPLQYASGRVDDIAARAKILVVEDDENILNLLSAYLESAGHDVEEHQDGLMGYKAALTDTFDMCIFDVMLPHRTGTEIAEAMRSQGSSTPVLFLTALGSEANVLQGFAAGADDYVVKPFSPRELVVRIQAILRRSQAAGACLEEVVEAGPLRLDLEQPTCELSGQTIALTPYEHKILRRLLEQPGRVLSRGQLITLLYGNDAAVGPKAIDVHVHNLRTKLGDETGAMIETVRGFGYRFSPAMRPGQMLS
ncbi:response regulator transcription factor [Roseibium sp. MMSF_3412]|uniref:response regulator transcription factor n=1 Tax=Roseibium sp. MMSF_3412 TaxID=3046712 RepID=UPI00273E1A39|nr:response regulator transcription factor [Roseibium sp. MMSF_3412]